MQTITYQVTIRVPDGREILAVRWANSGDEWVHVDGDGTAYTGGTRFRVAILKPQSVAPAVRQSVVLGGDTED